jgi:hypothetical protein
MIYPAISVGLINCADHRGASDMAPLGVITLVTLARPLIERIDQSALPHSIVPECNIGPTGVGKPPVGAPKPEHRPA